MVSNIEIRHNIKNKYLEYKYLLKNENDIQLTDKIIEEIISIVQYNAVSKTRYEKNKIHCNKLQNEIKTLKKELSCYKGSLRCLKVKLEKKIKDKYKNSK